MRTTTTAPTARTLTDTLTMVTRVRPLLLLGTYVATLLTAVAVALFGTIYISELPLPLVVDLAVWGLGLGAALASSSLARFVVAAVDEWLPDARGKTSSPRGTAPSPAVPADSLPTE